MQVLQTALIATAREQHTMKLIQSIRAFIRDEDGAAAIEYGLIAALIAIAIIVGATLLGTSLNGLFTRLGNCMATPTAAVCALVA
jgi:pilus assembly protein Flp/PilA